MPTWNMLIEELNKLGREHDRGLDPFGKDLAIYTLRDDIGILLKRRGFKIDGAWLDNVISIARTEGYSTYAITITSEGTEIMFSK